MTHQSPRRRTAGAFTLVAAVGVLAAGVVTLTGTRAAPAYRPGIASGKVDPVVVELFQSQGCSSCPPANANLNAIAARPDVLALSFSVTYWDRLGWKDTFGSPRWTERQWDYAHAAGRSQVATPQVIVNGGPTIVGSNAGQLAALIARAGPPRGGPELTASGATLQVGAGAADTASTVWLVRYDPKTRAVPIRAGENGGRTLPHRDIVRQLVSLGEWRGAKVNFALPAETERGLASAVLVQRGKGGPIIASAKI